MLLFRLSGVLLLRFAGRVFLALLFHDPPRSTRLDEVLGPVQPVRLPDEILGRVDWSL